MNEHAVVLLAGADGAFSAELQKVLETSFRVLTCQDAYAAYPHIASDDPPELLVLHHSLGVRESIVGLVGRVRDYSAETQIIAYLPVMTVDEEKAGENDEDSLLSRLRAAGIFYLGHEPIDSEELFMLLQAAHETSRRKGLGRLSAFLEYKRKRQRESEDRALEAEGKRIAAEQEKDAAKRNEESLRQQAAQAGRKAELYDRINADLQDDKAKLSEEKADLARRKVRVETLIEYMPIGMLAVDTGYIITACNCVFREMLDLDVSKCDVNARIETAGICTELEEKIIVAARDCRNGKRAPTPLREMLILEVPAMGIRYLKTTTAVVTDSRGKCMEVIVIIQDDTDVQELLVALRRSAEYDQMTGLVNKNNFLPQVDAAINATSVGDTLALIHIDLDDFKSVNETHGHLVANELLGAIGETIQATIKDDRDIGFRVGGDEFAILYKNYRTGALRDAIIPRLQRSLNREYLVNDRDNTGNNLMIKQRCSMGVAEYGGEGDAERLYQQADLAGRKAKHNFKHKGEVVYFQDLAD